MDIQKLTKKNQEFIHIATNQLIKDGKSDQEIKDILGNVIPELIENQKKGITGRGLLGAPTVWANSFSEKERYEKEHPKLNDAPSLMILDSFLFIFGVFAAISAFMNLVAPRRTGYGLITLILGSLTGLGTGNATQVNTITTSIDSISIWMAQKIAVSVPLFGNPCRFLLESCSFGSLSCPLLPYSHKFSTQLFQMFLPSF